jgi:rhamnosyltransferase
MLNNDVCGVVVTFHPKSDVVENLKALRQQVHCIVVVDNGSSADGIEPLRRAGVESDFVLIENDKNLGLPAALNIGIMRANELGFEWVLLFDQDSTVTDGFVDALIATYRAHPRKKDIGLVAPVYIGRDSGKSISMSPHLLADGSLDAAMTSGSLIPMQVIRRCGGFEELLMIDLLDYEFSLRLRSYGLIIVRSSEARLLHEPGSPKTVKLWGGRQIRVIETNAIRKYYFARNRVWIINKYRRCFPGLCLSGIKAQVKTTVKSVLFEDGGARKFWYALRGISDGILGRMGERLPL